MDQSCNVLNMNISELLKTSKQIQNKLRQELSRQSMMCSSAEKCPPIWNNGVSSPYIKNVVAEYLLDNLNLNEKPVELEVQSVHQKSLKEVEIPAAEKVRSKKPIINTRKIPATVSQTSFVPKGAQSKNTRTLHSPSKTCKTKNSTKFTRLEGSTNQLASLIKPSMSTTSVHRFPLQRFAGTSKESIDFSKKHPDLQLESFSNQTTLFPRRFRKGTETSSVDKESINVAAAETKTPVVAIDIEERETWNEVLSNNRTTRKPPKVVRLKMNVADVQSTKAIRLPEVKEQKGFDIISTPAHGLFQIEKETERLSKQQKCNLQSFPVMYIRPAYQVQRAANISIRGDNRNHSLRDNVKYVECTYEEKRQEVQAEIEHSQSIPCEEPKSETAVGNHYIDHNPVIPREENKYFKALRVAELPEHSSTSSEISSSSTLSRSASKAQRSSSPPSDFDVHYLIENILSSPGRPQPTTTKEFVENPPTRREVYVQTDYATTPPPPIREVYVQTDYTSTAATASTMPPPTVNKATSPLSSPPIIISEPFIKPGHPTTAAATTKPATDNFIEDDFISKIFDRIRNDVPNALQAFKNRNTTLQEVGRPSSPHQHQVSGIIDTSNAEIEPRLSPVQAQAHSIFETPPTAPRSTVNVQPPTVSDEGRQFLLLQQNPLFVQTINRIKSSAVHDAMPGNDKIKDDRHKYPTDAEIKRAVKIFLDSLSLQDRGDGDARKSITKEGGIGRMPALSTYELSSRKFTKYISSLSSRTSHSASSSSSNEFRNVKKKHKFLPTRGVSRSSTPTTSNPETESDGTISRYSPPSNKRTDHSLSEGEVLSIGEV